MFTRLVVEARFLRIYVCDTCGATEQGTTQGIEVDRVHVAGWSIDTDTIPPSPHYMPVGWASYYGKHRTIFKCGDCE